MFWVTVRYLCDMDNGDILVYQYRAWSTGGGGAYICDIFGRWMTLPLYRCVSMVAPMMYRYLLVGRD